MRGDDDGERVKLEREVNEFEREGNEFEREGDLEKLPEYLDLKVLFERNDLGELLYYLRGDF